QTSQRLAGDLGRQRGLADGARGESAKAADQAESLRVRAELMQVDSSRLVSTAERGRERVARASATLRAVGEEVRATASTVAGETKVRDIGAVAAEADGALQELHQGVQLMGDLVNATAEVSRSQAQRLADLAQSLQQVASISTASSDSANSTAAATEAQITAMGELTATSQQLAQLAERLRGGIARFSVLRRDQATTEHHVRPAAD